MHPAQVATHRAGTTDGFAGRHDGADMPVDPDSVLLLALRGGSIPINRWSLLVGMVGAAIVVLISNPLARRAGWRPVPTMVALLGLAMVVSVTIPENGERLGSVAACLPEDLGDVERAVGRLGGGLESLLNMAMLMPFAVAAVLATRRVLPTAVVVLVLPAVVELVQTQVPGRQCSPSDYLANVLGGLLAVAAGALLQRRSVVRTWLDEHEPTWPVRRIRSEVDATPVGTRRP